MTKPAHEVLRVGTNYAGRKQHLLKVSMSATRLGSAMSYVTSRLELDERLVREWCII